MWTPSRSILRLLGASVLSLGSAVACVGAMPEGAEAAGRSPPPAPAPPARPPTDPSQCPHGALEDPHRGFVRCLEPHERDLEGRPPPPQPEPEPPPDAAPPPPPEPPPPPGPPPLIEVGAPQFESGEVPKAEKSIAGMSKELARCVAENGGLTGSNGKMEVQFLVRARGRAEGVEVLSSRGVTPAAAACVRQYIKNRSVGAPTADPVGVTIILSLKPAR